MTDIPRSAPERSAWDVVALLDSIDAALPCGRSVDDLLEQVAEGVPPATDAHQDSCPHCQAALTELSLLWAPVPELARSAVRTPADLAALVMNRIHRLINDVWYTLQLTDLGTVQVAARVVARLARDAARTVPGVRVALGRSTAGRIAEVVERATRRHRHPNAAVGVLGRTAAIDLAIAVEYGQSVHEVAADVQRRVISALQDSIRLNAVSVNVTVDDVLY